ncbi:MAG: hypothetical protein KJ622_07935 [Alphaproteobacteria bacterium]|nr:hypothetical protein [Alphaproteobacteria bacterium]
MRKSTFAALIVSGLCFAVPAIGQDSLTATIRSVDEKGNIVLMDGSTIGFDKAKVKVEGTPVAGAKIAVVFSGDENGYEISKIVISE